MPKEPDKTSPDPVPSIDVLAAAAREDVKEAHHLLAGFDKPGRGPKRPQGADFVSYYANKPMQPLEPSAAREQERAERAAKTEVHRIPPHLVGRGMSRGTGWFLAGAAMLAVGGGVMWLALYALPAPSTPSLAPATSGAATTVATAAAPATVTSATPTTASAMPHTAPILTATSHASATTGVHPPGAHPEASIAPQKTAPAGPRSHPKASPTTSARNDSAGVL